jgi:excisionase family DNA binding protein
MAEWNDFMTTAEVAQVTRSPESTVRYWRHCGTGPRSFRLGRRVLYRRGEVDRWIAERERGDQDSRVS